MPFCPQAWRYRCEIAVIDDSRDAMVEAAVRWAVNVAMHECLRPARLSIEARMLRMQADASVMQAPADAA